MREHSSFFEKNAEIKNYLRKTIDREETLRFWSKNFPKLNSNELFDQVDKNNDGSIQLDEWLEFWSIVIRSGYSEDEVFAEVRFAIIYTIF